MKLLLSQNAEIFANFEWKKDKWAISTKDATILSWWKANFDFFNGLAAIFEWESIGYDVLIVDWADWEKYKNTFVQQERSIIKSKIYLKPQEKPPEGTRVQRGPRGGLYYETKISVEPKTQFSIDTKIITNSIFKIDKKDRVPLLQKRKELLDLIAKKVKSANPKFAGNEAKMILEIWEEAGYDHKETAPLWEAAMKENGKAGIPKDVQVKLDKKPTDMWHIAAVPVLQELIKFTKKLMVQKFGNAPITLYRGVSAHHTDLQAELLQKKSLEVEPRALESWTNSKKTAEFYAKEGGFVIKTTIHPVDVGLLGSICIPNMCVNWKANEFCLNKKDKLVISLEK